MAAAPAGPVSSASLHEAAGRRGALPRHIRPLVGRWRATGPAYTVQCPPRDNLPLHWALADAPVGCVIVCHVSGEPDAGYLGEVMVRAAIQRSVAGIVIDGGVRDSEALDALDLPVFSNGTSIRGTSKDPKLCGGVGRRLRIGDVDVDPGDLVVGDRDGVVVVPAAEATELSRRATERDEQEHAIFRQLEAGRSTLQIYGLPPSAGSEEA